MEPFFTNDAIALGLLLIVLAFVFYTASSDIPFWKKLYTYVPPIVLCYFLPAFLAWPLGLISGESEFSNLYFVASRYLLPASLILLCRTSCGIPVLWSIGSPARFNNLQIAH